MKVARIDVTDAAASTQCASVCVITYSIITVQWSVVVVSCRWAVVACLADDMVDRVDLVDRAYVHRAAVAVAVLRLVAVNRSVEVSCSRRRHPGFLHRHKLLKLPIIITNHIEGCYCVILHSRCSPLATPNASATLPQKWVNGDAQFTQICSFIIPF